MGVKQADRLDGIREEFGMTRSLTERVIRGRLARACGVHGQWASSEKGDVTCGSWSKREGEALFKMERTVLTGILRGLVGMAIGVAGLWIGGVGERWPMCFFNLDATWFCHFNLQGLSAIGSRVRNPSSARRLKLSSSFWAVVMVFCLPVCLLSLIQRR